MAKLGVSNARGAYLSTNGYAHVEFHGTSAKPASKPLTTAKAQKLLLPQDKESFTGGWTWLAITSMTG